MKHHLLIAFIISFCFSLASAQQSDELKLLSSSYSVANSKTGNVMFYRPVYEHKGSTLSADSGYLHSDDIGRDFFEAYGNVIITQPSGTQIFSDKLHYEAATQLATLTQNVRMVDGPAVLTTNYLTYDLRNSRGTYAGGGRIINQGDTITSHTAYYFEKTSEAYFKNKVVVRTPSLKIYTDTMQYNSISKNTYFFGPTNMKGNKGENFYTEKGIYNTGNNQARFSKNNLYTEGTKFFQGDSIYYDRNKGYGEAFENVTFIDTADKFNTYGGYGVYNQAEESIMMTKKPLVVTVVKSDSTAQNQTNSTAQHQTNVPVDSTLVENKKTVLSVKDKMEKDPLRSSVRTDSIPTVESQTDSIFMTADTLFSKVIPLAAYQALVFNLDREGGKLDIDDEIDYGDSEDPEDLGIDSLSSMDSISQQLGIDSLSHLDQSVPKIKPPEKKEEIKKSSSPVKAPAKVTRPVDSNQSRIQLEKNFKADSVLRQKSVIPDGSEVQQLMSQAKESVEKVDSIPKTPLDTAKTRIVNAYHNVRLFKSDFQAVADSVYYGMADSMFRFMGNPMIWAESSQISSDTIYLQIKNQKLDNALLMQNAFMVSTVLDSVKYNQLKGRKITSFFTNNKLDRLFVDGNAESLYFIVNEKEKIITELFHDRSARIKIIMRDSKIKNYVSIQKVESKIYPFAQVTTENEFLPGFIWKPQDRPQSKEDLLNRKREVNSGISPNATPKSEEGSSAETPPLKETLPLKETPSLKK